MPKLAINIVRFNNEWSLIRRCVIAALAQECEDFTVTLTENGSRELIRSELLAEFGDNPRFFFVDNGTNLGFAGAHNRFFRNTDAEFVMPLNPDTEMTSTYARELLQAFADPTVGAGTGKMLRFEKDIGGACILDGTGIELSNARRGRERGQLQIDEGQYEVRQEMFGVSGTAPIYRMSALRNVRLGEQEYYDEDFFAYWEDLDLSWRLRLVGYRNFYVPSAVIFHSRAVGSSKHGYRRTLEFIKHHRAFPLRIRRLSWRNQLFCILKNDFGTSFRRDAPAIIKRQIAMLCYIVFFEPGTLGAVPAFLKLLPKMLSKRSSIQKSRKVSSQEIGRWFIKSRE
jgi:GT2 family glycosyltransferase